MQHKGEIIEKAVRESGYSITLLAERIGRSRRWVYLIFEKRNVSTDYIIEIGKIIHHDFSGEIKDLRQYRQPEKVAKWEDPAGEFMPDTVKAEYWKNKYLDLLEEYKNLLNKK
ncbi:MAG: hypothetical protein QNK23_07675 [Crocinitomicaceae bacterium]|nr:hypothetical protein [Crocinitomicaceae bacterium]